MNPHLFKATPLSRRRFVATAAGLAAAYGFHRPLVYGDDAVDSGNGDGTPVAPTIVAGKSDALEVLSTRPVVLQTPTELLVEHRVTPVDRLFVRNNQTLEGIGTTAPWPGNKWDIMLDGAIDRPRKISLAQVSELPAVELELVLQCSGNGRAIFSLAAPTSGTQWLRGGMGNVRLRGVRLVDLLEKLEVDIHPEAQFITVAGKDEPLPEAEGGYVQDFQHSLPLDDVLRDSLLVTHFGENPLPAIHGGPLRLVTPGVFATMHIKWLDRITFTADESDNYNHVPRYRVSRTPLKPGQKVEFTLKNSRSNWWMPVKTVVCKPAEGSVLPAGKVMIEGVAFNDGKAPIETVLVSLDRGNSWRRAALEDSAGPYAWRRFRFPAQAEPGRLAVWTRAIDTLGRTQPLEGSIAWNPRGYEWSGVERIEYVVKS